MMAKGRATALWVIFTAATALTAAMFWPADGFAQAGANFYQGKQITMLVAGPAGGGYDTYARTLALRQAFDATLKDPEFLADAKRLQMEVDPLTGDEIERLLKTAYSAPAPIVSRAADLVP